MSKTLDVLVIVPVFNEYQNITNVIKDLEKWFDNIIIIDDGSTDRTLDLINHLRLRCIKHYLNLGQGAAIESGLKYFLDIEKYNYAITFDGDGQNMACEAFQMLCLAKNENLDAVLGSRFLKIDYSKKIPKLKKLILKMARFYECFFYSIKLSDAHNGLRVLKKDLIKEYLLPLNNHDMSHATEISYKICKSNCRFQEFPIHVNYDNKRTQSFLNSINIVINNLLKPFRSK